MAERPLRSLSRPLEPSECAVKKLLILLVLVALGAVMAKKVREA